jgi:hypothetical protein
MPGPQVLVVDELSDTEEVLRAVLAPRGVQVRRVTRLADDTACPALIVVDAESDADDSQRLPGVPQIVLGRVTRLDAPGCHVLPKPFHYAELIRAVEDIIDALS